MPGRGAGLSKSIAGNMHTSWRFGELEGAGFSTSLYAGGTPEVPPWKLRRKTVSGTENVRSFEVPVGLEGLLRQVGDLQHLGAGGPQVLGSGAVDEDGRLARREHDPADAGLKDELRAAPGPGAPLGAGLHRGVDRGSGEPAVPGVQLDERGLLGVDPGVALPGGAVGDLVAGGGAERGPHRH